MKISKFLFSFLFIGASVVGQGLIGNAAEKMAPTVPTADAPTGGSAPAPTAQKSDTLPSGGAPIESPSSPGTLPPAGSSPTDSPPSTPPAGGAPVSPAEPPSGGPGTLPPSGPSPTDSPSTPPSSSSPSSSPSPEPQGGGNLSPSSTNASPTKSSSVLATCGRGGASFVYDNADEVPVGCHVSAINAPPASVLQQK